MKRTGISFLASIVALALLAGACGDAAGDGTTTAPVPTTSSGDATTTTARATTTTADVSTTTTETTTTTSEGTTTTTDEPLDPVGEPQTDPLITEGFPGTGETAFLTDARLGRHEGFERLVLEFDEAAPEYRIEYIDGPVIESPSGQEIEVEGDTYLMVTMSPATGFDLSGDAPEDTYQGPDRFGSADTFAIEEVVKTEDFENVMSWVIGMDDILPFGVTVLENPFRLVIDIRTA